MMRIVMILSLMGVTVIMLRQRMGLGLPMGEQLGGYRVGQLVWEVKGQVKGEVMWDQGLMVG